MRATCFILMLAVAACLAVGCGKKLGPDRFAVRGAVKFAGQPVPRGSVALEPDPAKGNRGPVSVIPIIDGSYDSRALSRPGPLAGPLVARVTGYPAPDPAAGPAVFDFDVPTPKRGR